MQDIRYLFKAAFLIEKEGDEAVHKVIDLVGEDVAVALLIAHIRRQLTDPPEFKYLPLDPQINVEITKILKNNHLIQ
ncbi:hypothetical protein HXX01_02275 [Candidatus Nomurabacteria bacterium]|nr:hypothetical protein [Candidatus Nomurabacteria bacterium]